MNIDLLNANCRVGLAWPSCACVSVADTHFAKAFLFLRSGRSRSCQGPRRLQLSLVSVSDPVLSSLASCGRRLELLVRSRAGLVSRVPRSSFVNSPTHSRPHIRRDYPLNLSILLSGGKETNQDSLSNGERTGNSSNFKSRSLAIANCSFQKRYPHRGDRSKLLGTAYQRG